MSKPTTKAPVRAQTPDRSSRSATVALLQDPSGIGGIPSVMAVYQAWAAKHRPGQRSYYLDDAAGGSVVRLWRWDQSVSAVPRVLPRLQVPMYRAAQLRMRGAWNGAEEVHVLGAHVMHGSMAPPHLPSVAWLGTLIDDERRPTLAMRSAPRRYLYRATLESLSRIEREVLGGAQRVIAQSAHTADLIVARGIAPAKRVEVKSVPVDTDTLTPPSAGSERSGLLFVGRSHDPRKGFFRIRRLLDVSGPARSAGVTVVSAVDPSGGPAIRWLGPVSNLAAAYRKADLLVLPSVQEGLGIVALEAMACATPVVAYRCGGSDRILAESGGGVVVDDDATFRSTIERLLADPSACEEMGRAGRSYVERNLSLRAFLSDPSIFEVFPR